MIEKIKFTKLSTNLSYLAIGGIRFYDGSGNVIESGKTLSSSTQIGETEEFLIKTPTASYLSTSAPILCDTSLPQDSSYFRGSSTSGGTIEITFKNIINSLSRIEFVPLPNPYTNLGITNPFDIEIYDEKGNLTHTFSNIIPITKRGGIQMLTTNELIKYYVTDNPQSIITTNNTEVKNITSIKRIKVTQIEPKGTMIRYILSWDDKNTWKIFRNNTWKDVDNLQNENILNEGMDKAELEQVIIEFREYVNLNIKCVLMTSNPTETPSIRKIDIIH